MKFSNFNLWYNSITYNLFFGKEIFELPLKGSQVTILATESEIF